MLGRVLLTMLQRVAGALECNFIFSECLIKLEQKAMPKNLQIPTLAQFPRENLFDFMEKTTSNDVIAIVLL